VSDRPPAVQVAQRRKHGLSVSTAVKPIKTASFTETHALNGFTGLKEEPDGGQKKIRYIQCACCKLQEKMP